MWPDASSTADEVQQFFTELGSGSPSQVADAPAKDDDQDFEKNQDVSWHNICNSWTRDNIIRIILFTKKENLALVYISIKLQCL